jgi:hypothetical protein
VRFAPATFGVPDLRCADGARTMVYHPGSQASVGVAEPESPAGIRGAQLVVAPNPLRSAAEFRLLGPPLPSYGAPSREPVEFTVLDLQGRLVRRLRAETVAGDASGSFARVTFDGRDGSGRPLGPGRYWVWASQRGGWTGHAGFLILR